MVGTKLMSGVALRLREIFGPHEQSPFLGSVHVAAFGDFAQLVPVKDDPVWANGTWKGEKAAVAGQRLKRPAPAPGMNKVSGSAAWKELSTGDNILLRHIWRQAAAEVELRGILFRQRDGQSTNADVTALNERHISKVQGQLTPAQAAAFTLAQSKAEIAELNKAAMETRNGTIRVSRARDEGDTKGLGPEDFRGLGRTVFLQRDARYLLTANLWVDAGLYNGTECYLHYAVFASAEDCDAVGRDGAVAYVVMSSRTYTGPQCDPNIPHSFKVPTLTRPASSRKFLTRTQLPLICAAGITVHKSQGMSLEFFFLLFGENELALGSTYVSLSRATSLLGVLTRDVLTLKRLIGLSLSDRADMRRAFDIECDKLSIATMQSLLNELDGNEDGFADGLRDAIAAAEAQLQLDVEAHRLRLADKAYQRKAAVERAKQRKKK